MNPSPAPVLVVGEALIDAVIRPGAAVSEHVGGSPANVAFGLGALDHDVRLATWIGDDDRGRRIADRCAAAGVTLTEGSTAAAHTSVAQARIDEQGHASYEFDLTWEVPQLADLAQIGHVHTGSIAATIEPGGSDVLAVVGQAQPTATVSYDPNMRPTLMGSPDQVVERVEALVALADVVKASDEDLAWLYPGQTLEQVLEAWERFGPGVVVVTRGGEGVRYAVRTASAAAVDLPARPVAVADTVGAGDSFMAGLISGLLDAGFLGGPEARARLHSASTDALHPAIERALATSSTTVTRVGAYAPTRAELG
jgi:fructokinase